MLGVDLAGVTRAVDALRQLDSSGGGLGLEDPYVTDSLFRTHSPGSAYPAAPKQPRKSARLGMVLKDTAAAASASIGILGIACNQPD